MRDVDDSYQYQNNQNTTKISVTYQTYDVVTKTFLLKVIDTQDYAGILGEEIDAVQIYLDWIVKAPLSFINK